MSPHPTAHANSPSRGPAPKLQQRCQGFAPSERPVTQRLGSEPVYGAESWGKRKGSSVVESGEPMNPLLIGLKAFVAAGLDSWLFPRPHQGLRSLQEPSIRQHNPTHGNEWPSLDQDCASYISFQAALAQSEPNYGALPSVANLELEQLRCANFDSVIMVSSTAAVKGSLASTDAADVSHARTPSSSLAASCIHLWLHDPDAPITATLQRPTNGTENSPQPVYAQGVGPSVPVVSADTASHQPHHTAARCEFSGIGSQFSSH
ncbi:hypothetical protein TOPH_07914 [Tolypocladium ophioglossoides CBS 100239]|uniref:Uncharacterized protein n=1 Tax=Tolypocladium ophioglossoides (strain CBS 100239) TaxID=1163406 RepID=A0A0L0N112_TOLOC|nr:hypothetical protein TOPH_07914 [Tolypocladium ophioglossoides CBS 100239]